MIYTTINTPDKLLEYVQDGTLNGNFGIYFNEDFESDIKEINGIIYLFTNSIPKFLNRVKLNGTLMIYKGGLNVLENIPLSIEHLNIPDNNITQIDLIDHNIESLTCRKNQISSFYGFPKSLTWLNCNGNKLTSFKYCPQNITQLFASFNEIKDFVDCPENLEFLELCTTPISSLKGIPQSIKHLVINNNSNLSSFEHCPKNLLILEAEMCIVDSMKFIPETVDKLLLSFNRLTNLDYIPPKLSFISVFGNPIHKLYTEYDKEGNDHHLAYLISDLKLDSRYHTTSDIHPILEFGNYEEIREVLGGKINLQTNSCDEIVELLKTLI